MTCPQWAVRSRGALLPCIQGVFVVWHTLVTLGRWFVACTAWFRLQRAIRHVDTSGEDPLPSEELDVVERTNVMVDASQAELLRLQQRVMELEAELGQRSWRVADFYRKPTVDGTPDVLGQVATVAQNGRPFQVIEAAEPDLMPSVPVVRALNDGLSPNVVPCAKPHWWPL